MAWLVSGHSPKKVLRELNVHEINGSLLSCLYPLE